MLLLALVLILKVTELAGTVMRKGYKYVDAVGEESQDTHSNVQQEYLV